MGDQWMNESFELLVGKCQMVMGLYDWENNF